MEQQRCSEKPCPWPVEPGQTLCGHHLRMFSYALEIDEEEDELVDTRYEARDRGSQIGSAIGREELSVSTPGMGLVELEEKREAKRFKKTITRLRGKRSYETAKTRGRCYNCGKPRGFRNVSACEDCRQKAARYRKEVRLRRLKSGLCVRCGRKLPENYSFQKCSECREAFIRYKRDKRNRKLGIPSDQRTYLEGEVARLAGISVSTLDAWVEDGLVPGPVARCRNKQFWTDTSLSKIKKLADSRRMKRSRFHLDSRGGHYQYRRHRRSDLKEKGQCITCGKENDRLPRSNCSRCKANQNRLQNKKRAARIVAGACITCGEVNRRLPKRQCARCAKRSNKISSRYQRNRRNSLPDGGGSEKERCQQQQQSMPQINTHLRAS
jgi:DNA-binding transcriptional MerR regulator